MFDTICATNTKNQRKIVIKEYRKLQKNMQNTINRYNKGVEQSILVVPFYLKMNVQIIIITKTKTNQKISFQNRGGHEYVKNRFTRDHH